MIKTYTRIAFLLAIVGCILTSTAYADFSSNLSLEIVNTDSNSGVVVNSTDNLADINGLNVIAMAPGYIQGNFQLLNIDGSTTTGNFVVALSDVDVNQATLTLGMNIQSNGPANIQITIKDDAYNVPNATTTPNAGFSATLTNYTSLQNDLFPIIGGSAQLASGSTASFNSWMNTADQTPTFSGDTHGNIQGGVSAVNVLAGADCTLTPTNCAALSGTTFQAGDAGLSTVNSGTYGKTVVALANPYAMVSQANLSFTGGGQSQFALVSQVSGDISGATFMGTVPSAPEPASLLLLGSGLVGLGALRRKHSRSL